MRNKNIFLIATLPLFFTGCEVVKMGSTLAKIWPLITESREWSAYSKQHVEAGIIREKASASDKQYVNNRLDKEFLASLSKVISSFEKKFDFEKELKAENIYFGFKMNDVLAVKDRTSKQTIGYCVNFDADISQKMKTTTKDGEMEKMEREFAYVDRNKPFSVGATGESFVTDMCGAAFYKGLADSEKKAKK